MMSIVLVRVGRLFFFFQAEDGIRDFHVTGVQTCALPIYAHELSALPDLFREQSQEWRHVNEEIRQGRKLVRVFFSVTSFSPKGQGEIGRASCRERVEIWAVAGW